MLQNPVNNSSPNRSVIVLTGGTGGGKTTLIEELRHDPTWTGRFVALPETFHYVGDEELTFLAPISKLQPLNPIEMFLIACHQDKIVGQGNSGNKQINIR